MKYLKSYENLNQPQIGDYVILTSKEKYRRPQYVINFLNNNIGKIIDIIDNNNQNIIVKYDHITDEIKNSNYAQLITEHIWSAEESEIMYINKDKKKLEKYIIIQKYNL